MEDERRVEMDCLAAIFPEMTIDPQDPFSATLELPAKPNNPVKVIFPASAEGSTPTLPTPPRSEDSEGDAESDVQPAQNLESHSLSYLPPLLLHITLPEGYPSECPPIFKLSTSPAWLSRAYLDELQENGTRMWEEGGHTEVVYGYIDSLQQAAENAFGYAEGEALVVPREFKIALLDYDIKATQAAFDKETFECGVCLDPKKGSACHRMIDCGHVFCVQCMQDFYNNAITEGDLAAVRCLTPGCAKKREEALSEKGRKGKSQLSPSELLQIPLDREMVLRYVNLKHKAHLESDKNTIYCPRKWCQGAARSKKHRKPDGLEVVESDDEGDSDDEDGKAKFQAGKDLLCVCEDCSFAFCSRCFQGWHGEFTHCMPRTKTGELTEEDKASIEYLKHHTTPCPTCAAPAQKTHGCNHMICFKCNSHFCYLCSAWLEPGNPYKHYNTIETGCYMRLWELEFGDGDDVGIGYEGGHPPDHEDIEVNNEQELIEGGDQAGVVPAAAAAAEEPPALAPAAAADVQPLPLEAPEPPTAPPAAAPAPAPAPAPPAQELQREGPLVLRINFQPAPPPAPRPAPEPQPAQRQRGRRGNGNANRRANNPPPAPVRQPGQRGGRARMVRAEQAFGRGQARDEAAFQMREAEHQEWVQRFVQMALNDEEDLVEWDSGDEDAAAWEIPVR